MQEAENRNEEWFLGQLEQDEICLEPLMEWLILERKAGKRDEADSLAELLQETLAEQEKVDNALSVLAVRADWRGESGGFRQLCEEQAISAVGTSPEERTLVRSAGFDGRISLNECFRRLSVLRGLRPDVLCYDATWGAGVVKNVDWFYKKVTIDFEKKRGHELSFSYAGETLEILRDGHLLALKHNDPDGLQELIDSKPAEVVRIALRSFGEMSVVILQEVLIPRILPESDWKKFWDAARRGLKKDVLFEIPSKRVDPLRILEKEKGFDDEWFSALSLERDVGNILSLIENLKNNAETASLPDDYMGILVDRLAFVITAAGSRHLSWLARAAMAADDLNVQTDKFSLSDLYEHFFDPKSIQKSLQVLSARDLKALLQHLWACDAERMADLLLALLPQFEMTALNEAMDLLIANGCENRCRVIIREQTVERQVADVEILYWLLRNPGYLDKWELGTTADHARWVVRALETQHVGEKLKTQNQLRKAFSKMSWLEPVLKSMPTLDLKDFFVKVKESTGWDTLDRRALLGLIIKRYPKLEEIMRLRSESSAAPRKTGLAGTSRRSYEARQQQLKKIVLEDIPATAKEIAVAREYGDLRENFEYKAAKDKQALLLQRKADIEAMLNRVRPIDFVDIPSGRSGQGTMVTVCYADGHEEMFTILGAWDRDEDLNIISSDSRMAVALSGYRTGSKIVIPSEHGDVPAIIKEVSGLSQEIQDWMDEGKDERVDPV